MKVDRSELKERFQDLPLEALTHMMKKFMEDHAQFVEAHNLILTKYPVGSHAIAYLVAHAFYDENSEMYIEAKKWFDEQSEAQRHSIKRFNQASLKASIEGMIEDMLKP